MQQPQDNRKAAALLIGINYIMDTQNRLNGCHNDVMNMANMLVNRYRFPKSQVQVIADTSVQQVPFTTREAILCRLYELALKSWRDDLEIVFFHYSGHGSQQRDFNGDEADGLDEGICPCDFDKSGLIIDDELLHIFKQFNPKTKIVAVFDCCHSGTILDLPYQYNSDGQPNVTPTSSSQTLLPNLLMISGCIDSDVSADAYDNSARKYGGALTMCLMRAIEDSDTDKSVLSLHRRVVEYLKRGTYGQRPVLSATFSIPQDLTFA